MLTCTAQRGLERSRLTQRLSPDHSKALAPGSTFRRRRLRAHREPIGTYDEEVGGEVGKQEWESGTSPDFLQEGSFWEVLELM